MSRIGHDTPLRAYDHIASLLKDRAGPDGVVSREDAKSLVEFLRKEGRGTEALAAENLFKMIDHQDNAAGARVTGFDLDLSRRFVEARMLENRDINRNGYSRAEIEKMSPTARALIELGQVLEVEKQGGRIGHDVPDKGAEHIAGLLRAAAGPDGIISRADLERLGAELYQQGRGTEGLAADFFGRFIDHRDAAPGARITASDVDRALEVAKESLLRSKDQNHNGYSQDEIAKFSTTAKAFLLVGQMIEAGIID